MKEEYQLLGLRKNDTVAEDSGQQSQRNKLHLEGLVNN